MLEGWFVCAFLVYMEVVAGLQPPQTFISSVPIDNFSRMSLAHSAIVSHTAGVPFAHHPLVTAWTPATISLHFILLGELAYPVQPT